MSGVRQSVSFAFEDEYGVSPVEGWTYLPPGAWFTSSFSRTVNSLYEVGKKQVEDFNFGKISGTWQLIFTLDYNYLEPLLMVFEGYDCEPYAIVDDQGNNTTFYNWYNHKFYKTETGKLRSVTFRRKVLHKVFGNAKDEMSMVHGAICTSMTMSQSGGKSQIQVNMSGIYSTESTVPDDVDFLDVREDYPMLAEYGCVYCGDKLWGNTINWGIQVSNNAIGVYGVGNPTVKSFYEGQTNNAFTVTILSENPDRLIRRAYSGGYKAVSEPVFANSRPIPQMTVRSWGQTLEEYSVNADTEDESDHSSEYGPEDNLEIKYRMDIDIRDCVVNMVSRQSGDGDKMLDSLTKGRCGELSISFMNQYNGSYLDSKLHEITNEMD